MTRGLPETTSPEAEEGTMLHKAVASGDITGLTAEQMIIVEDCRAMIAKSELYQIRLEHEMSLLNDFDIITTGTADAIIIDNSYKLGKVFDWKMGRIPVAAAKDNIQVKTYAKMAADEFGLETIICVVHQPRIHNTSEAVFVKDELEGVTSEVLQIIDETRNGTQLRFGEQCRYCAAKPFCVEYQREQQGTMSALAVIEHASSITDPAAISEMLTKGKRVKRFIENLEHHAREMLMANQPIPGWELRTRRGGRVADDAQAIFSAVQDIVSIAEFLKIVNPSLPKLDDIYSRLRKAKDGTPLKTCKKELAEKINAFVTRKPDSIILKSVDGDDDLEETQPETKGE